MTIDKKHPHGVLGASLAMGSRGIIPAEAVESKSPRPGREWWDRLCALPRHMFLLKPSGTGVQKLEDPSGNWIDVHDAQRLMDGAQSDINELRGEVARLQADLNGLQDLKAYATLPLRERCAEQKRLKAQTERLTELAHKQAEALRLIVVEPKPTVSTLRSMAKRSFNESRAALTEDLKS